MEEINQSIYAVEKQKQRNGQQWLIWALQINPVNRKKKRLLILYICGCVCLLVYKQSDIRLQRSLHFFQ